MKKKGKVWLVGAGPSDVGLFTLKGKEVLEGAETVVYDKLVGEAILKFIPKCAKKVYVGKVSGNHSVPQEEINNILLREALDGKKVVRLKGGDPFLFGRGGEELELLAENSIEFEIVPGITSAISVPAYAGIPVTHRDFTSSLHIITGHTKKDGSSIDYASLVNLNATLVFLMGVKELSTICTSLIKAKLDKNTPAAIIESGTTSKQRKVVSTVEHLPRRASEENIGTPSVIVIGEVASLSNKFSWIEKRPLNSVKVLVTRPETKASRLTKKLYNEGAEVVEIPTIETKPIESNLVKCIENLNEYQWIILTSPTGVEEFFKALIKNSIDIRKLLGVKFAAVGSATKKAIGNKGIIVDFIPSKYNGETLAKELIPHINGKVLIPRAKMGSNLLAKLLQESNVEYNDIPIYETNILSQEINPKDFDYIAFTSASTVKGFVNSVKGDYSGISAICIGHETESEAKKYFNKTYVSKVATLDSMVELLKDLKGEI